MRVALVPVLLSLTLVVPSQAQFAGWQLSATVAESCSCTVSCPCNFGGEPSRMPCEGNRFITIDSGRYQDVDLAGVQLLVRFNMCNWSKIYVRVKVSEVQMKEVWESRLREIAACHNGRCSM